jgi:hypothetical protein
MRREARGKKLVCGSDPGYIGVPEGLEASAAWSFRKYPLMLRQS